MAKKEDVKADSVCNWCCCGGNKSLTFAILLLVVGVLWFLSGIGVITVDIPWWPVILIVIAAGWIINSYKKK